jgi:hypothetical protein
LKDTINPKLRELSRTEAAVSDAGIALQLLVIGRNYVGCQS